MVLRADAPALRPCVLHCRASVLAVDEFLRQTILM